MSGNAALSAARKRRASSSPGVPGSGVGSGFPPSQTGSYYSGNSVQNIQAMLNQPAPGKAQQRGGPQMLDNVQQIPINVYENIELIRQQIEQRMKLIQTQGGSMPPEKVKILHKQNEVQNQILKQRLIMVQEMELAASIQSPKTTSTTSPVQMAQPSFKNEPQFIYDKGIPRQNPKYNANANVANTVIENHNTVRSAPPSNIQTPSILTPFVSMITTTGATPPPLVILKSHDEKIGEHDAVLNDLANRINYIHSRVDELSHNNGSVANVRTADHHHHDPIVNDGADADADDTVDADADAEEGDETVLLMDTVMNDLIGSRDFVQGIVDKIVNETNLSETIMKIEPIIKENQELRSLIHSQQKMLNEMNIMVLRLLNKQQYYTETDADADADAESISISISNSNSNSNSNESSNEQQSGMDENGLYQSDVAVPLHSYIVPNMDNVVISVCENVADHDDDIAGVADMVDRLVEETHADNALPVIEETQEHHANETHDDDAHADEYENTQPHFPSDSRIALVINEI